MSHYSKHLPTSIGSPRVMIVGGGIVGVGLLGFFSYLNRKHDRKVELDRSGKPSSISSWETRMLNRNSEASLPNAKILRASRIEAREEPVPSVKTEHDAHHRTFSEERAMTSEHSSTTSGKRVYEVPTAQRDGNNGHVYTKAPNWLDKGLKEKVTISKQDG
ncbi:hypothetical protein SCHPADRAFT_939584 [Schizopora paradoxa]|uniref:Uncharacterized protein n=1 Tax=Schizopora paradoxa TaxID=27342 RepID=A0A0H2SBZ8_9AGAM|nr:hypothetical protein SCHPADRAFT_939584 [Schizopora paradoxa]